MSQQYELKIGVFNDERLQVSDLLKYLEAETNESLVAQVKRLTLGVKSNERFTSTFERIPQSDIQEQQYVGFLMIYNSSQFESVEYIKQILTQLGLRGNDETFLIIVEMESKDKVNLVNQQGQILANKYRADFVKLTFENTGELLHNIGRYITQMLESYYHPNSIIGEEDEHHSQQAREDYELNYISRDKQRELDAEDGDKPLFEDDEKQDEGLINRAMQQRESRMKDIGEQEKDIDTNIQNLQKVLENMDVHIRSKIQTDWFINLKNSIYSRAEKESESFSKSTHRLTLVKLTQHFIKQAEGNKMQRIPMETIFINRRRNLLMRLQLVINKSQIVIDVYADSTFSELAKIALRNIGLKLTDKNVYTMRKRIEQNVGGFVQQLNRSIDAIQQKKLANRRLLK